LEFVDITFIGKPQAPEKLVQVLEEELPLQKGMGNFPKSWD
jgi:hypothetical protein